MVAGAVRLVHGLSKVSGDVSGGGSGEQRGRVGSMGGGELSDVVAGGSSLGVVTGSGASGSGVGSRAPSTSPKQAGSAYRKRYGSHDVGLR